ncbi:hypothetical protein [Nonomuraea fuscirosea]|uniref:hypothetical protein n=1 Tax=Nonomuraea fuscirosea TaxID=1291556 RepID=UPI0033F35422
MTASSQFPAPAPNRDTLISGRSRQPGEWDGRIDTVPLLRTTDIRSMERMRAIHAYARQGIVEIDAALAVLDRETPAP